MTAKKNTLLKRRKIAIAATAVLLVLLTFAMIFILDYVNATSVEDPADGTVYYIRQKKQVYALYDTDKKTVLPTDGEYGYYVTHAGSLVKVDASTGKYEIYAIVDTEGNESVEVNRRLLIFPHLEDEDMRQIDVYNEHGSFTFSRLDPTTGRFDSSADFAIKGAASTAFNQEKFIELQVTAGYTVTQNKLKDPIKDANGAFSEYGLVAQRRVREVTDEDGEFVRDDDGNYVYEEYDYVPAYYVITDTAGVGYKIIVGDRLTSGNGYYAQYISIKDGVETPRDAVYVLDSMIASTVLVRIEDYVTPSITYPMSDNTYFDVENFVITSKDPNKNDHSYSDPVVGFSYVDMGERENTSDSHIPYVFLEGFKLDGYQASDDNISDVLSYLYSPSFVEVTKLAPTEQDLEKYGLVVNVGVDDKGQPIYELLPEHIVSFNYDVLGDDGKLVRTVNNVICISKQNEDGNYYVYTDIYEVDKNGSSDDLFISLNMIVEVEGYIFEFLNWDRSDWISKNYVNTNIAFCDKITVTDHSSGFSASFDLDNSESNTTEDKSNSDLIKVTASNSNGVTLSAFQRMVVTDVNGLIWTITSSDLTCHAPTGEKLNIPNTYYAYNAIERQVLSYKDVINCADGRQITVSPDSVEIRGAENVTLVRYDIHNFRQLYRALAYSSIADSHVVSDEEEKLLTDPSNLLYTITLTETTGREFVYRFYHLTSRKSYITINGNGGFYVLATRPEKLLSDAQRFFEHLPIYDTAKT